MRAGTLQVSDGRLETGWWGPGPDEAPTLVLLHEGLGCVALWRDVPERQGVPRLVDHVGGEFQRGDVLLVVDHPGDLG